MPPMALDCAIAVAASFAELPAPPQILFHALVSLPVSAVPVIPEREMTRAAPSAAASADRCASSRARYNVTTSMESAAMATMQTATRTMVTPRSPCRCAVAACRRCNAGGFIASSILVHDYSCGRNGARQNLSSPQQAGDVTESPRVGILNAYAGGNDRRLASDTTRDRAVERRRLRRVARRKIITAVDDDAQPWRKTAIAVREISPGRRPARRRRRRVDAAIVQSIREKVIVDQGKRIADRNRNRRGKIAVRLARRRTGRVAGNIGQLLLQRISAAEIEDADYENYKQRQRYGELDQLSRVLALQPPQPFEIRTEGHGVSSLTRAVA